MFRTLDFVTRSTDGLKKILTIHKHQIFFVKKTIWKIHLSAIKWPSYRLECVFCRISKNTKKTRFSEKSKVAHRGASKIFLPRYRLAMAPMTSVHSSGPTLSIRWQSAKNMILGHFLTSDVIVKSHYSSGFAIWLIGLIKLFSLGRLDFWFHDQHGPYE